VSDSHPSFANPTIVEVVCDIHFRLPRGKVWQAEFFGGLFNKIQSDYPSMEPVSELQMQVAVGPLGIQQHMVANPPKVRFKHAKRQLQLQFVENSLTLNVLPKYPGWDSVQQDVLAVWPEVREVVHPKSITRIGLRYINRIPREVPGEPPGEWLQACEYIPAILLKSKPGFLMRTQVQLDINNRIIITTADVTESEETPEVGPIIFDIDRIIERDISPGDKSLAKELKILHDDVWDVFNSVQTPKLLRLLNKNGVEL
jgi:uncharacterized protein (TIGR04255 family)